MCFQVFLTIEAFSTITTAKRVLPCVIHHLLGQISFGFEGLATNGAGVRFPAVTESDVGLWFTGGFTGSLLMTKLWLRALFWLSGGSQGRSRL